VDHIDAQDLKNGVGKQKCTITHCRKFTMYGKLTKPYNNHTVIGRAENPERALQAGDVYAKKVAGLELSNQ
jgi:hypothetical protein